MLTGDAFCAWFSFALTGLLAIVSFADEIEAIVFILTFLLFISSSSIQGDAAEKIRYISLAGSLNLLNFSAITGLTIT